MLDEIEIELGRELPASYKNFVERIDDFVYVTFNEFPTEFPEDSGAQWFFWGVDRLRLPTSIRGIGSRPAYRQLELYAQVFRDSRLQTKAIQRLTAHSGCIEQMSATFALAENNGDLLFLHFTDEISVWIFMHDSGQTKHVARSFQEWLDRAVVET